jgi:molecular chaperone DnaJ
MAGREDLYIVLEVNRSASENEIKRAFRKLARRFHPDINPGDRQAEEQFKRITEAYDILSDPLKREFYDVNGFYTDGVLEQRGGAGTHFGFSFQGFDFSRSNDSGFQEIFGYISNPHNVRSPEPGQDLEYPISISFEESIRGLNAQIGVTRMHPCGICSGTGQAPGSREMACQQCGGSGKTIRMKGHLQFSITCGDCGGSGRMITPCPECRSEGRVRRAERLDVEVPPGVATSTRIRIPGKGDAGRCGGPVGDLYVVITAATHPFFQKKGDNIHCTLPLTVMEAALGTKIEVPTIDGPAILRVPPGSQSGQLLRMRGKGTPSLLNPEIRGDQYVELKVVVPRVADERSKEILRELAKLNPENPRKDLW